LRVLQIEHFRVPWKTYFAIPHRIRASRRRFGLIV
jgi:hypothetical protein